MEKINIGELDEYVSRQKKAKKNQKISYLNIKNDDSLNNASFNITENINGKINLLSVRKKEGKYVSIQKTIYHDDYREIIAFNEDGNLKSKTLAGERKVIEDAKFGEIYLNNRHLGTSIYVDERGDKIAEYDYESLYKFKFNDLIANLKESYSEKGELVINKLFLSEFTVTNVDEVLNDYKKQNIPLKKEYPYWTVQFVYKNSKGSFSNVIFIDGVTGDKIAEQVTGPVISVD